MMKTGFGVSIFASLGEAVTKICRMGLEERKQGRSRYLLSNLTNDCSTTLFPS